MYGVFICIYRNVYYIYVWLYLIWKMYIFFCLKFGGGEGVKGGYVNFRDLGGKGRLCFWCFLFYSMKWLGVFFIFFEMEY